MAALSELHQGTVVTWQRQRWEVQHHGCATGMGRGCPHADHAPIAALHVDSKGKRAGLTQCLPSDQVVLAYDLDRKESDPCERLTPGCPVRHQGDEPCETW